MTGKYAFYLPYKTIDALNRGKVTDTQFRQFIMGLINYDQNGVIPEFQDTGLNMLFEVLKSDIDYSWEKYDKTVEASRDAGKIGGSSKSQKKQAAARVNALKGGGPEHNQNAVKRPKQNEANPNKTIQNQTEKTTQADTDVRCKLPDINNNMNDDPSSPFFYLDVKRQAGDRGFIIKHKQAQDFIDNVDNTWLTGRFNFFDYIAEGIKEKYFDLPLNEQTALFVDSWNQGFLISRFPAWRAEKERTAAETAKKKTFDNPPQICEKCGAGLLRVTEDRIICKPCRRIIDFVNGVWVVVEEGAA